MEKELIYMTTRTDMKAAESSNKKEGYGTFYYKKCGEFYFDAMVAFRN